MGQPLYDTDWFKETTQSKPSQNYQLGVTGGNQENSYGVFVGYRDDNGLLLNSYLKRYSARFVMDSQIKPWLKVGGSLGYNSQEENIVDFGTGGLNVVRMITEALPNTACPISQRSIFGIKIIPRQLKAAKRQWIRSTRMTILLLVRIC